MTGKLTPTPAQARLLRKLIEADTTIEVRFGRCNIVDANGRQLEWLRRVTVSSCKRLGWLQQVAPGLPDDWGGGGRWLKLAISDAGRDAVSTLPPAAFISPPSRYTSVAGESARIMRALWQRHQAPEWVVITEIGLPTADDRDMARLDALALSCYSSSGYRWVAYEIKVSRSDFFNDMRNPRKLLARETCASELYYAVPQDLVRPDEIPAPYGLLYVSDEGRARIRKRAAKLEHVPTRAQVAALLRRVSNLQEETE